MATLLHPVKLLVKIPAECFLTFKLQSTAKTMWENRQLLYTKNLDAISGKEKMLLD
jgi:hypothetical protein